jgi:putative transposase
MATPGAKREAIAHAREHRGVSERAAERRRFGYRRLGYLLAREGITPNHKKHLRIYREEGLRVRRRGGRKRALGTRRPMVLPDGPNQRWSLAFVSDSLICGRRFRILYVVDDYTRECLALVTGNNQGSTSGDVDPATIDVRRQELVLRQVRLDGSPSFIR